MLHPVMIIGWWLAWLEKILHRPSNPVVMFLRGLLYLCLAILPLLLLFIWMARMDVNIPNWLAIVILAFMLATGSLLFHVAAVARGLHQGLKQGQNALQKIVSRKASKLDKPGVARSALESLSENFSDGVVAPLFFYLLFGLTGAIFYKIVNTADSMVGYKHKKYFYFGKAAARLDDIVNFIPARLSAVLYLLAGLFYDGQRGGKNFLKNFLSAIKITLRHAPTHASPNSGWPEAALAGIMNIKMGGKRFYPGGIVKTSYIGVGRANLTPRDITAGVIITALAAVLAIIIIGLLWLLSAPLYAITHSLFS